MDIQWFFSVSYIWFIFVFDLACSWSLSDWFIAQFEWSDLQLSYGCRRNSNGSVFRRIGRWSKQLELAECGYPLYSGWVLIIFGLLDYLYYYCGNMYRDFVWASVFKGLVILKSSVRKELFNRCYIFRLHLATTFKIT